MYRTSGNYIVGFHGCDRSIGERILQGKARLRSSKNHYDWLGYGIYFWQSDPKRAMEYAKAVAANPRANSRVRISDPFVIGAILTLGNCLDLLGFEDLKLLAGAHRKLHEYTKNLGEPMPVNRAPQGEREQLIRNLDCAVIEMLHTSRKQRNKDPFDSVRSVFLEGPAVYRGAAFRTHNHIQVCVRNPNCIKGYFRPLKSISRYEVP